LIYMPFICFKYHRSCKSYINVKSYIVITSSFWPSSYDIQQEVPDFMECH
jgi:hypothetical protein